MYKYQKILLILTIIALQACTSALHPFRTEQAHKGIKSMVNHSLKELPDPESKVIAAVYRFRDQTGQYKPSQQIASWSTAVTQGATSILIKSMEDSGWFTPIERESISNLLNEREIISKTRQQNNLSGKLPPLLFAGILLEGGVIGYDTNIITGGGGLRILGVGASGQYRKDQVTIYLRAVSTQSGRVLKTVHTTKSILSQQLESGAFLFVDSNTLLETEAGFSYNEPPVLAVTEAIDEAVRRLIIEGVEDDLWKPEDLTAFEDYKQRFEQVESWKEEAKTDYFGFKTSTELRDGFNVTASAIGGSYIGNFENARSAAGGSVQMEYFLSPQFSVKANVQRSGIGVEKLFFEEYTGFDGLLTMYLTPNHAFSPFASIGAGTLLFDETSDFNQRKLFPTGTAEGGIEYKFSKAIGLRVSFAYRYALRDGIDGIKIGKTHDQQWNIATGIVINPKLLFNNR